MEWEFPEPDVYLCAEPPKSGPETDYRKCITYDTFQVECQWGTSTIICCAPAE